MLGHKMQGAMNQQIKNEPAFSKLGAA